MAWQDASTPSDVKTMTMGIGGERWDPSSAKISRLLDVVEDYQINRFTLTEKNFR